MGPFTGSVLPAETGLCVWEVRQVEEHTFALLSCGSGDYGLMVLSLPSATLLSSMCENNQLLRFSSVSVFCQFS